MNLWRVDEALREAEVAKELGGTQDLHAQEKMHFDQGETFFRANDFEKARKEFQIAIDLKIPDSTIRVPADNYLKRMRQTADSKKLYDTALGDIKNESWADARQEMQDVVDRKRPVSPEGRQRVSDGTRSQKAAGTVHRTMK